MTGGGYHRSADQQGEDDRILQAIVDRLNASAAIYVKSWLPNAIQRGQDFFIGSIEGEPGESMKIWGRTGYWKDYNPGGRRGGGDMLALATHCEFDGDAGKAIAHYKSLFGFDGKDPQRIAKIIREAATAREKIVAKDAADANVKRNNAHYLWGGSRDEPTPSIARTPAQAYLEARGIDFATLGRLPGCLRYRPDIWCSVRSSRDNGLKFPAMLACIYSLDGAFLAVHRTYLNINGWNHKTRSGTAKIVKVADAKGRMKSHKSSMGRFALEGGFIPLWKGACRKSMMQIDEGTPVYISEGIEDGLSWVMANPSHRVIAGVSLDNIANVRLPPQAGPITILTDNDAANSDAAATLERVIKAQQMAGRTVHLMTPPSGYKDFNDYLMGNQMAGAQPSG